MRNITEFIQPSGQFDFSDCKLKDSILADKTFLSNNSGAPLKIIIDILLRVADNLNCCLIYWDEDNGRIFKFIAPFDTVDETRQQTVIYPVSDSPAKDRVMDFSQALIELKNGKKIAREVHAARNTQKFVIIDKH